MTASMYDDSDAMTRRATFQTEDSDDFVEVKLTGAAGIKLGSPDWDHPGQPADAGQDWAFETEMTAKQGRQPTTWEDRGGRGRPYSIPKPDRSPNRDGVTRAAVSRLTGRLPSYKLVTHQTAGCPGCWAKRAANAMETFAKLAAETDDEGRKVDLWLAMGKLKAGLEG